MIEVSELFQRRLGDEIERAGIEQTVLDCFSPSRKDALHQLGSALVKYADLDPTTYADNYPWENFAPNILTAGVRNHFCELTATGLLRSYELVFGPAEYGYGASIRSLVEVPLPDETDFDLLEKQAVRLIEYIRVNNHQLREGVDPSGLPVDEDFVTTKVEAS